MATVTRPIKDNGTVNWKTGDSLNETDVEGDISGITDQVDGNLDNDNIAPGAGIDASKLAAGSITNTQVSGSAALEFSKMEQTAAALDADIVDDFATTDAEYNTMTSPGDSSSVSKPTNLEEELSNLRYVIKRLGLGTGATLTDGSAAAAWFDGVSTGANLIQNPAFLDYLGSGTSAPQGWAVKGSPTSIDGTATMDQAEGVGHAVTVTSAATADGIQQTLSGLKKSTRYLVEARTRPTTSIHSLKTTGATGTFGDLDIDSADGGSVWATLAGVIETDSTPTDIVLSLEAEAGIDVFDVAWASVREVGTTDKHQRDAASFVQTETSTYNGTDVTNLESDTTIEFVVPGDNYSIVIVGQVGIASVSSGDREAVVILRENNDVAGAGAYTNVQSASADDGGTETDEQKATTVLFARSGLTAGSVYGYHLSATLSDNSQLHSVLNRFHRIIGVLVREG